MNGLERWRLRAATCAALLALSACGGGSDGGSPAAAPQNNAPIPAATQPGAPALTGNIPADGLAWFNYRRSQMGLSVLVRNPLIDKAAQSHSDYQKTNNKVTHDQEAGLSGFTGVNTQDRLKAAGYVFTGAGYAGEVISATSSSSGFYMAEELIAAIYHRFAIFEPKFKEIGTGSATTNAGYTYFTTDFTTSNGIGGGLGRGVMATWPTDNQTLVPANFFSDNETPDPVPTLNVNEVGYPVSVHADIGSVITVNSFTMRQRGSNTDLSTKPLNPGDAHTPRSVAAIIPLAVLKANTVYDVSFKGTVDGTGADRNWSFTTK